RNELQSERASSIHEEVAVAVWVCELADLPLPRHGHERAELRLAHVYRRNARGRRAHDQLVRVTARQNETTESPRGPPTLGHCGSECHKAKREYRNQSERRPRDERRGCEQRGKDTMVAATGDRKFVHLVERRQCPRQAPHDRLVEHVRLRRKE